MKADRAAVRARRIAMEMVDEESGRFALQAILASPPQPLTTTEAFCFIFDPFGVFFLVGFSFLPPGSVALGGLALAQ